MTRLTLRSLSIVALFGATVISAAASGPPVGGQLQAYHAHHARPSGFLPPFGASPYPSAVESSGGGAEYGGWSGPIVVPDPSGVNGMSRDFGTSGVLGHTNGLPVTGH